MRYRILIVFIILASLLTSCAAKTPDPPTEMAVPASPVITPEKRIKRVKESRIIINKAQRQLLVYDDDELAATMTIALGSQPMGHKENEGDGRTPEGEYYVCYRNKNSKFYLSLGLSYPNAEDAKAGLDHHKINEYQYERIKEAIENKERPLWNTALGGEIMIHGHGTDGDWTAGCIAVENDDMKYLWKNCPLGTPVTIFP